MSKLDKNAQSTLKELYKCFEASNNINVSSPKYEQTLIDYLIEHGLIKKIDASTLSGWEYIISPTYEGKIAVDEISKSKLSKIAAFIEQGKIIMKEEYHPADSNIVMPSYISGPKSNKWFNEINIFNNRFLKEHPLHDQIDEACKKHDTLFSSSHKKMMGYLDALYNDDKLDDDIQLAIPSESKIMIKSNNELKKKYQVFISSTYKDLIEERSLVTQCLLDCDCIPVGMEQFPASNMSQMEYIKKMLNDCDYYILILAGRYGSKDTDGIGFTEKEYDYAIEMGLPVLSFVFYDIDKLPKDKLENSVEGITSLKAFRDKVCSSRLVQMYKNPENLKSCVAVSINKCKQDYPALGWIRPSTIDTNNPDK